MHRNPRGEPWAISKRSLCDLHRKIPHFHSTIPLQAVTFIQKFAGKIYD